MSQNIAFLYIAPFVKYCHFATQYFFETPDVIFIIFIHGVIKNLI